MTTILGTPQVSPDASLKTSISSDASTTDGRRKRTLSWTASYLVEFCLGKFGDFADADDCSYQRLASRLNLSLHNAAPEGSEVLFAAHATQDR